MALGKICPFSNISEKKRKRIKRHFLGKGKRLPPSPSKIDYFISTFSGPEIQEKIERSICCYHCLAQYSSPYVGVAYTG